MIIRSCVCMEKNNFEESMWCVEINTIYHPNEQKWIEEEKKVFVNSNFNQRYNYYVMQQKKIFFSLLVLKILRRSTFTLTERSLKSFFFLTSYFYILTLTILSIIPLNTPVSSTINNIVVMLDSILFTNNIDDKNCRLISIFIRMIVCTTHTQVLVNKFT